MPDVTPRERVVPQIMVEATAMNADPLRGTTEEDVRLAVCGVTPAL